MSCNCNAKYDNKVPCCCSQGSPLVCSTTTCADAQKCDKIVESDCVIYSGPNIPCAGVTSGMTVTEVMDIILEGVNLINCSYCWRVTNDGTTPTSFNYIDINGEEATYALILPTQSVRVCGRSVTDFTDAIIENLSRCSTCFNNPIETRCTATGTGLPGSGNYYQMERTWINPSYTFTLNSLILDGVEYASGETITLSASTLNIAVSTIDGLVYVQSLNDWLNSIPGVSAAGWTFYDDMHTIDRPSASSVYYIQIESLSSGIPNNYWYTSLYGFGIQAFDTQDGTYACLPKVPVDICYCYTVTGNRGYQWAYTGCDGTPGGGAEAAGQHTFCAKAGTVTASPTNPLGSAAISGGSIVCTTDNDCTLPCYCYTIESGGPFNYSYIKCDGSPSGTLPSVAGTFTICAQLNSVITTSTSPFCPPLCTILQVTNTGNICQQTGDC